MDIGAPRTSLRPLVGRGLLWLAALESVGAGVAAISDVIGAGGSALVVETWRMYGLLLCVGLFVLLAMRPRVHGAVWALVIANKAALALTATAYAIHGGVDEATTIAGWDGAVTVMLIAAYFLCREQPD